MPSWRGAARAEARYCRHIKRKKRFNTEDTEGSAQRARRRRKGFNAEAQRTQRRRKILSMRAGLVLPVEVGEGDAGRWVKIDFSFDDAGVLANCVVFQIANFHGVAICFALHG